MRKLLMGETNKGLVRMYLSASDPQDRTFALVRMCADVALRFGKLGESFASFAAGTP